MAIKQVNYKIKGMQQDLDKDIHNPEFSFENINIRINNNDTNGLLSILNLKGTTAYTMYNSNNNVTTIIGVCLGNAVINNNIVLFTTDPSQDKKDSIYLLSNIDNDNLKVTVKLLFNGNLNFSIHNPIETIVYFENNNIQKVYWIDGINLPRVINIMESNFNENSFDFAPSILLTDNITIDKIINSNGNFPTGTIQYAFTYIGINGQETNVFYTSPLLNTSKETKGGLVNTNMNNAFNIKMKYLDTNQKYVRVYSIIRTSIDTTPIVKKIIDIDITSLEVITEQIPDAPFTVPIGSTNTIKINLELVNCPTSTGGGHTSLIPICVLIRNNLMYDLAYYMDSFRIKLAGDAYWTSTVATLLDGDVITFPKLNGYIKFNGYNMSMTTITIVSGASNIVAYFDYVLNVFNINFPSNTVITSAVGKTTLSNIDIPINITNTLDFTIFGTNTNIFVLIRVLNEGVIPPTTTLTAQWVADNTHYINLGYSFPPLIISTANITNTKGYIDTNLNLYSKLAYNDIYIITPLNTLTKILIGDFSKNTENNYNYTYNNNTGVFRILEITLNTNLGNILLYTDNVIKLKLPNTVGYTINNFYYRANANTFSYTGTSFIDTNNIGELVTPTHLLYAGGTSITPGAITLKDNTLFLGNILLNKDLVAYNNPFLNSAVSFYLKDVQNSEITGGLYTYKERSLSFKNTLNKFETHKGFKSREWYRFGILFLYKTGEWSEVFFIKDALVNINPSITKDYNTILSQGINAKVTINNSIASIVNKGFKKVRGVVVFPEDNDRSVVAQGVVNPTLYNPMDRYNHTPDVISSWMFRPFYSKYGLDEISPAYGLNNSTYGTTYVVGNGSTPSYKHNYSLFKGAFSSSEIQSNDILTGANNDGRCMTYPAYTSPSSNADFRKDAIDAFFIDQSIFTLHSPDIEFGNALKNTITSDLKLRLIGFTTFNGFNSSLSLTTSTPYNGDNAEGFIHPNLKVNTWEFNIDGGKALLSGGYVSSLRSSSYSMYVVHPWHTETSVCGWTNGEKGKLASKKMSNLRYSNFNYYFNYSGTDGPIECDITDVAYFNSEQNTLLKLPIPTNSPLPELLYEANVEKLITFGGGNKAGYKNWYTSTGQEMGFFQADTDFNTPIKILYKSTPHAVCQLNWGAPSTVSGLTIYNQRILPGDFGAQGGMYHVGWIDNVSLLTSRVSDRYPPKAAYDNKFSGLWLAELYRDDNIVTNRFGGTSDAALQNNKWVPAGEPISLIDEYGYIKSTVDVLFTEGDTYFQRYDCLKTYGDASYVQSMVEILSFMCETRVNLDARTDNNRGLSDNRLMNPTIFNLFNTVYNQKNNYFNPAVIDKKLFSLNKFSNTFVWSASKLRGSITDAWTNVNMASSYDVNGSLGKIQSLQLFNDYLIGLQDRGIFNILYNSRVQINASDGVPIELALSGKVDGVKYISTNVGTKNKLSVTTTPKGVYFIDDEAKTINIFNGLISVLSDELGMRSWIQNHYKYNDIIDINNMDNFSTFYDKNYKDVYFINNLIALCFSETLGTFTSLYDYQNVTNFFNVDSKFYSIYQNKNLADNKIILWQNNNDNPGYFYGQYKNSSIKYLVNPEPKFNKIFDNIILNADVFDANGLLLVTVPPISKIYVNNEYQQGQHSIDNNNFRLKFRVWRGLLPRVNSIVLSSFIDNPNRLVGIDRVRNPWTFIGLEIANSSNNTSSIIHDTTFLYSI